LNTRPKTLERTILALCKQKVKTSSYYTQVTRLDIDEQSHQKGKKYYICVLTDLDAGTIIDILQSRKKDV
jgi:transposase